MYRIQLLVCAIYSNYGETHSHVNGLPLLQYQLQVQRNKKPVD